MTSEYLKTGEYFCMKLSDGITKSNVWVSDDNLTCSHIAGATCMHPDFQSCNCHIWEYALRQFQEHSQSSPK
jgi:hypothetical protein